MNKVIGLICVLVICSALSSAAYVYTQQEQSSTIIVDDDGTPGVDCDFNTITEGVDAANPNDMVYVKTGKYYENVVVNKAITLAGEDRHQTIVDGSGSGCVIQILAPGIRVGSFTIVNSGAGYAGIYLPFYSDNIIENNICWNNDRDIELSSADDNTISNNIFNSTSDFGLTLSFSSDNVIINNTIQNHMYGVYMYYADNNTFQDNIYMDNTRGIFPWLSNNNTIENNTFMDNTFAIRLQYADSNTIKNNTCTDNSYGVHIYSSTDNIIEGNTFTNNTMGAQLHSCTGNKLQNNTISNNRFGLHISYSDNNYVYHNEFISNINQGYDTSNNQWDNGYPSGGNYWSDWIAPDTLSGPLQDQPGPDGFVDFPKVIPGGLNTDRYPVAGPAPPGLVHNLDTDTWHDLIQDGVDNASDNHTLEIYPHEFNETVRINKTLVFIAGNSEHVTVLGNWMIHKDNHVEMYNMNITVHNLIIKKYSTFNIYNTIIEYHKVIVGKGAVFDPALIEPPPPVEPIYLEGGK